MRILSIHAENFRLHADTKVNFEDGITGIIGTNESGKSTLATEALLWAFYGGKAVRGTMDGVRWHRAPAKKPARVTVVFEVGGTTYTVNRSESTASIIEDGKVIAQGTAPTNKYLPKLLGMGHDEFITSYLVKQKDVARIGAMLPTERQAFIREVMGVGRLDHALKEIRKTKSALAAELKGVEAGLGIRDPLEKNAEDAAEALDGAALAHEEALRMAETAATDAVARAEEYGKLEEQRTLSVDLHRQIEDGEKTMTRLQTTLEEGKQKLALIDVARGMVKDANEKLAPLPELRLELEKRQQEARFANELERLAAQYDALTENIAGLEHKIDDYQATVVSYSVEDEKAAKFRLDEARRALKRLQDERREERAKDLAHAATYDAEAAKIEKKINAIEKAGEEGCCPTCTRVLGEQYHVVLDTLLTQRTQAIEAAEDARYDAEAREVTPDAEVDAEIEVDEAQANLDMTVRAKQEASVASSLLDAAVKDRNNNLAEQENINTRMRQIGTVKPDFERLEELNEEIRHLEALQNDEELLRHRGILSTEQSVRDEIDRANTDRLDTQILIDATRAAIEGLAFSAKEWEEASQRNRRAASVQKEADIRVAGTQATLKHAESHLGHCKTALEEYDAKATHLKEIEAEHLTHERAADRLSDFRVAVAGTIRPEMEELMSGFVRLLTDGRHESVELSEDFTATLFESGTAVEVVSGGTEDIAALAMRLALSQMISERAGHPLSLLVLDEPFGSLDETRRGNVLELIQRLKEVFKQVIVISHVAETRDAVDHVIELAYDEAVGASRLVA